MAILVPTGTSSYADSTTTEGGRLRKYVLAQFRSDSDLEWVRRLRAVLVKDEIKYRDVKGARPRLRGDKALWAAVERGVGQASVVVVDPEPFDQEIRRFIEAEGSNIRPVSESRITAASATAIIGSTPIAYLPMQLVYAIPLVNLDPVASLADFAPAAIQARIGPGLRQAMVFAARAHAAFDLREIQLTSSTTRDLFRSPLATVFLAELLATPRIFDVESPPTVQELNRAADLIALAVADHVPTLGAMSAEPLVREVDSRAIDELQAADIAAGWARDILEVGSATSLLGVFERIWLNGARL